MQLGDNTCPPAKPAGASGQTSPAAQPSGATSSQAQFGSTTMENGMPPMLKVRAAPQPQPARWADEE
eukprot:923967-Pyramimonas_sp.AAC.1